MHRRIPSSVSSALLTLWLVPTACSRSVSGGSDASVLSDAAGDAMGAMGGGADAAARDDASPSGDAASPEVCVASPCGGDLLGRWTFTAACARARPTPIDDCDSGAANTHNAIGLEGTVIFGVDGIAEFNTRPTWRQQIWAVRRCYLDQSCSHIINAEPPLVARCTDAGAFCDCTITQTSPPWELQRVPFHVSGNVLELDTGTETVAFTYCVSGDTLSYVHTTGERTTAVRAP